MNKEQCEKCKYHGYDHNFGGIFCNFMLVTGKRRQLNNGKCKEYKEGKKIRPPEGHKYDFN